MIRPLLAVLVLAVSLLGATFALPSVANAAPGEPDQVALVVQTAPGSVQVRCVDHTNGMSGADVLAAASPAYGTGPYAGFVLQIGGFGNTASTPPSDSTYWAYWRGTGTGTYSYSGAGVTSTQPAAGTVEAWVWYGNGAVAFPRRSYASLCPGGYAAAAAPAIPAATPTGAVAAPPAPAGSTARAGGSSSPATVPGTGTGTGGGAPSAVAPTASPAAPAGSSVPSTGTPGVTASPEAPTSVAASNVAATAGEAGGGLGVGSTVGLLAVAAAVVGFAVLAVLARRRRLDQD